MPFSDACFGKGVQPIIGAMLGVARPTEIGGEEAIDWLALLAKDEQGYANLCKLVSAAHLDRPVEHEPHVEFAKLEGLNEGLIALTAGAEGALARLIAEGQRAKAEAYLDRLQALFPDRLYIELSRRHDPVEEAAEEALIDLAYARNLPLVATNPAAYADPSFHAAHDAMLCIANSRLCGKRRPRDFVGRRLAQGRHGDGRAIRRPARGARQYRGDRAALRRGGAQAQADPAAPRRRRGRAASRATRMPGLPSG